MTVTPAVHVNASRTVKGGAPAPTPKTDGESANDEFHCWTFASMCTLGPKAPRTSAR